MSETGKKPRVLVVTSYHKEERALIERTIRSVANQTAAATGAAIDHMLIADGFPQDWIDGEAVRHIRLDLAHADYGNTPRGVGTLLGVVEDYDAICYCDADNWFEPDHIAACLALAAKYGDNVDYVVAQRTMRRPDGSVLPVADEPIEHHVDTNCFFFLPSSFPWLHRFASMPRPMSSIGDRIFYASLKAAKLKMAVVQQPTVAYQCMWESIYRAVGERPPEGAKPNVDSSQVDRWLDTLTDRERTIVARLTGFSFPRRPGMAEPSSARPRTPRVLVVSAYYKEDRAMLEACVASVAAQTAAAKGLATIGHMLVADGFPQDWIDGTGLRHIKLDRAHGDYGNTPRGVGALLALAEDWDALCFLDADNQYQPHHVEACLARAQEIGPDCDWLLGLRFYRRPDWSLMPIRGDERDIDTNCFFFLRGSFHLLHHFATQPREIALAGDQVFHQVLKNSGLVSGRLNEQTVDYLCMWAPTYERLGETPPPGARPFADPEAMHAWLMSQPPARRRNILRLIGLGGQGGNTIPGERRDPPQAGATAGAPAAATSFAKADKPAAPSYPARTPATIGTPTMTASPAKTAKLDISSFRIGAPTGDGTAAALAALETGKPRVRTFGVFDTLIARRCIEPSAIFELVAQRIGMPDFPDARKKAEAAVAGSAGDIDAIYDELAQALHLDAARVQEIKAIEIEVELEQALPIAENLAEVRHGDILICDTHLSAPIIRRLLDKVGADQQVGLIATSTGKSSGEIWRLVTSAIEIKEHLGADAHADVSVPASLHIQTRHTALSELSTVEEVLKSLGLRPLAELCRETRLVTWSPDQQARKLQLVQASLNLPILLLSSVSLLRLGEQLGKRSVLFSGGNCDMWRLLFDEMARRKGAQRASSSFYTSRSARTHTSPGDLRYARQLIDEDAIVVDLCGSGSSWAHLAQELGREEMPLFLFHQHAPIAAREINSASPGTCVVHSVVPPGAAGLDCSAIEMCNYSDHGKFAEVRLIGDFAVPVFAPDSRDAATLGLIRAQHVCFKTALRLLDHYDWRDILDLDDDSIRTVCAALYEVLSRQNVLKDAFGSSHA
ncbi:hypothetical protein V5F38_19105 [Xanthobacter sp. V0B-10]|uniref:hypothetical protein n=1 Tax=Xanthobacter albus TaxID=3119929 RepID=UPI00372635ED